MLHHALQTALQAEQQRLKSANSVLIIGGGPVGVEVAGEILTDLPGTASGCQFCQPARLRRVQHFILSQWIMILHLMHCTRLTGSCRCIRDDSQALTEYLCVAGKQVTIVTSGQQLIAGKSEKIGAAARKFIEKKGGKVLSVLHISCMLAASTAGALGRG